MMKYFYLLFFVMPLLAMQKSDVASAVRLKSIGQLERSISTNLIHIYDHTTECNPMDLVRLKRGARYLVTQLKYDPNECEPCRVDMHILHDQVVIWLQALLVNTPQKEKIFHFYRFFKNGLSLTDEGGCWVPSKEVRESKAYQEYVKQNQASVKKLS